MKGRRRARAAMRRMLDGELPIEEQFRLEALVAEDPELARELESMRALEECFAKLPEPPVAGLDLDRALAGIHAELDLSEAQPHVPPTWRRVVPLAAAASALVAALLGLRFLQPSRPAPAPPSPSGSPDAPVVADAGPSSVPVEVAEAPDPVEPAAAVVDSARMEETRTRVAGLLVASFAGAGGAEARATRARRAELFELAVAPTQAQGWPVETIALGLLSDAPAPIARAAARYLGVAGDSYATRALESALDRDGLERATLEALGDRGEHAAPALARAARRPGQLDAALEQLHRSGPAVVARVLQDEIRDDRGRAGVYGDDPARTELLDALASCESWGLAAILNLRSARALERRELERMLDAEVVDVRAADSLFRGAAGGVEHHLPGDLLLVAERLRPVSSLEALARIADDDRVLRDEAVAAIATLDGAEPLLALLDLGRRGRARSEAIEPAFARQLAASPRTVDEVTQRLVRSADEHDRALLEDLYEILVLLEDAATVPALLALVEGVALDADDRILAAQHVREVATLDHVEQLERLLGRVPADERKLAAVLLLTLDELLGLERALDALGPIPRRADSRLRGLLGSPRTVRGEAATLLAVARELEPLLSQQTSSEGIQP